MQINRAVYKILIVLDSVVIRDMRKFLGLCDMNHCTMKDCRSSLFYQMLYYIL